jgi:hypothetical protein
MEGRKLKDNLPSVAYFCMEFGLHEEFIQEALGY